MKKLFFTSGILLIISLFTVSIAQNNFQGFIDYKTSVEGGEFSAAERAQMEMNINMAYGDGMMKQISENVMGKATTIMLQDSAIVIYSQMGQEFAIGMSKAEMEKMPGMSDSDEADSIQTEINLVNESKTILGFECKKAEITYGDKMIIAWYYDKYSIDKDMKEAFFKDLPGVPLEYTMPGKDDSEIHVVATLFKPKNKMKSKLFAPAAGIEVMTIQQMREKMGQ